MSEPKITIVTVVYNGAAYLEQTILSVISQAGNIEYIIIDGGSTDGTLDIIKRYEDKIDYWVSESDKGIYDAMNKGIERATGDYIGMLNADDWYEPGIIDRIAAKIKESGVVGQQAVIYSNYYTYDAELSSEGKTKRQSTMQYWKGMSVSHQAMFISKAVYDRLGPYDMQYRLASDYDYYLKMIAAGVEFIKMETYGVNFRMSGQSIVNVMESIREASLVNRRQFGYFSDKHLSFILNNHVASLPARIKILLYKIAGKEKTVKIRRLWHRLKPGTKKETGPENRKKKS